MIDDPIFNELRERSWRQELNDSEESTLREWLAKHPEAQADWEAEIALNDVLRRLPDAPLSNNFTSRVVQAVRLEQATELRRKRRAQLIWLRRLAWKLGLAGIVGAAVFFCYEQVHSTRLRAQVGQSVVKVSAVTSLPSAEILENFEAIRLSASPAADEKLLSLLE
jgi:anti-sigma factor RsiW